MNSRECEEKARECRRERRKWSLRATISGAHCLIWGLIGFATLRSPWWVPALWSLGAAGWAYITYLESRAAWKWWKAWKACVDAADTVRKVEQQLLGGKHAHRWN